MSKPIPNAEETWKKLIRDNDFNERDYEKYFKPGKNMTIKAMNEQSRLHCEAMRDKIKDGARITDGEMMFMSNVEKESIDEVANEYISNIK